jgi:hypothetical protein
MPSWLTPELFTFVAGIACWAYSKIRDDRRAKKGQITGWARDAFWAVEGAVKSGALPKTVEARVARWTDLVRTYANAAGVALREDDWKLAAAMRDSAADAEKAFRDALSRLAHPGVPRDLAPSFAPQPLPAPPGPPTRR